ncbi:hypothetical protein [Streptomyces sp. NPDC006333]|uniref:hypothetical protein n=1 Tax=unclassified Streptomyces TaxID=2593676 RepID=UPI00339EFFF4
MRAGVAAVPVVGLVPAAWLAQLALTPDTTHGGEFAADVLLILLSMVAASVHAWKVWPRRPARP